MINETPPGWSLEGEIWRRVLDSNQRLAEYLIGDLGVVRRHLHRLQTGQIKPSLGLFNEMSRSVEDCIKRIERDLLPLDWKIDEHK